MPLSFLMGLVDPRAIPGHEWLHVRDIKCTQAQMYVREAVTLLYNINPHAQAEQIPILQPEQLVYVYDDVDHT